MKNRKREICTSGSVRDEDGNILIYSAAVLGKTRRTLRQEKSRRGGREYDLKPFNVIQRVQLPPGKGEPANRK